MTDEPSPQPNVSFVVLHCGMLSAEIMLTSSLPAQVADEQPCRFDEQPEQIADCRADAVSFSEPQFVAF